MGNALERERPVGPMCATAGESTFAVTFARRCELLAQPACLVPAATVLHAYRAEFGHQRRRFFPQIDFETGQATLACRMDILSQPRQIMFPRVESRPGRVLAEQRVALTQCPSPGPPQRQRRVFHVEHAPVKKTSPLFGRAQHQRLTLGAEVHTGARFE